MAGENFAGNIIVSLASIPDFLRQPMLTRRMTEFFTLSRAEKQEIIDNALEAGPDVDFGRFEKLFRTWLIVLAGLPPEQRTELVAAYITKIAQNPKSLVAFNTDAIWGIYLGLQPDLREPIAASVRDAVSKLDAQGQKVIRLMMPDTAQRYFGIS